MTGASSGIGRTVVRHLVHDGWLVAATARRVDRLADLVTELDQDGSISAATIASVGSGVVTGCSAGSVLAVPMDVTSPEEVSNAFDVCAQHWGRAPDLVVSNAGVSTPGLIADITAADVASDILTNLLGPALVAQRALSAWQNGGCGRLDLIFVSSDAAPHPRPFQAAYSAAKQGTEQLAAVLAMEYDHPDVRISVVRPGATISEFASSWVSVDFERVIATWRRWGLQQHLDALDPDVVSEAILWVANQPDGAHVPIVEVQPRPPHTHAVADTSDPEVSSPRHHDPSQHRPSQDPRRPTRPPRATRRPQDPRRTESGT